MLTPTICHAFQESRPRSSRISAMAASALKTRPTSLPSICSLSTPIPSARSIIRRPTGCRVMITANKPSTNCFRTRITPEVGAGLQSSGFHRKHRFRLHLHRKRRPLLDLSPRSLPKTPCRRRREWEIPPTIGAAPIKLQSLSTRCMDLPLPDAQPVRFP